MMNKYPYPIFMGRKACSYYIENTLKPTTIMKNPTTKKQKTKTSQTKVVGSSIPPLTAKQKKVLQAPLKAGWEEQSFKAFPGKLPSQNKRKIVKKSAAKHKPKTLAKFSNIAEFRVTKYKKNDHGSIELCYNKITKQTHFRSKGKNGEILFQSEPMHNRKDVINNIFVGRAIFMSI